MNLYEDTNPRELKELLRQINGGETVLPDFQRNFVWDPNMTMELIISIAENYPAGSLLRIRNTQNLFAYREFEGAPALNGLKPIYLVLDGQQRLTSLYQAFYGIGESRYYLNLQNLLDNKDFEDSIFHIPANRKQIKKYDNFEYQAKELILPLSILKDGAGEYIKWVKKVSRLQSDAEARIKLEDRLDGVYSSIQTIDDYRFPVVTLSDSTGAEAVCTIFETLNRTGVKLSPFELLTARFWHQNLNLRQRWDNAVEKYPVILDFNIDPYYSLQIVSLIARSAPSCKRSEVLNLDKSIVEQHWDDAIEGLGKALKFIQEDCGVLTPLWLPYITIVVPMAAIFARTLKLTGPKIGTARDKINRWFWCSIYGQKYESAANSQSALDFGEVTRWINGGDVPESVRSFRFDPAILRDTTSRQRAVYRGTIALIMRHRSHDFHSHKHLTLAVINDNHVDDHHIFPNKYLERQGVTPRLRDCVLNHTLIDRTTNILISDRAPSDYLEEIRKERGNLKFTELLDSHLLPSGKDSPFREDDFETFLNWRQETIFKEIQNVTGLSQE
ncbi:MAG: DUF262 domain-containing protein [Chloroflexi bacterium]|nr:DUF262 domain-containing protein [Chloroflexota bacterium]